MGRTWRYGFGTLLVGVAACPQLASAVEGGLPDAGRIEVGQALYEDKCAQCHGVRGDGAGVAADRLQPPPRDFTLGSFKIRTTPSGELPTDEDLAHVIRHGMPYTAMPPWPSLGDEEISSLVTYLQTFNPDFSDPEMQIPPMEIPDPPRMTEESIRLGREVYLASKCFDCHGDQGRGDGPSAPTLKDDSGRAIPPADMTKRWTFRGGPGRIDIYRTFTTGLDGTPMPSYADSIPEEQRWQLVDYVYSLSRDAPGYGSLIVAKRIEQPIPRDPSSEVLNSVEPILFPMVGQVIEPQRNFTPAVNEVEVRAVYDDDVLAILVSWNLIEERREGTNRPDDRVPPLPGSLASDAVAVQLPSDLGADGAKPYFLYGDSERAVDLWFYDAAEDAARVYRGRGVQSLAPRPPGGADAVEARGSFQDGRWQVLFVASRRGEEPDDAARIPEGRFLPIGFSAWAGHRGETGNRRAISGWHHIYLQPTASRSPYAVAGGAALAALFAELLITVGVRRGHRHGKTQP